MCLGIKVNKEKIGNLMIYLASHLTPLYHTKLIKLLYLIDEEAVKDNGVPITWLDYKVWQHGPVAPEVFFIKDNNSRLNEYVLACKANNGTVITPNKTFDKSEFSRRDMKIINTVLNKYGDKSAEELVNITHLPGSLWEQAVKENNLDFQDIANISNIVIDFKKLIINDEIKLDNYEGAKDVISFSLPSNCECEC